MSSLFSLTSDALSLYRQLTEVDPDTGELLSPDVFDLIVANNAEIEAKCDSYANVKKMIDGDISVLDTEIKRLQAIKAVRVNSKDKLMQSLQDAMLAIERDEIKTALNTFKIAKNRYSVDIVPQTELPGEYTNTTTTIKVTPDKTKIKNELLEGKSIEGCSLKRSFSIT